MSELPLLDFLFKGCYLLLKLINFFYIPLRLECTHLVYKSLIN